MARSSATVALTLLMALSGSPVQAGVYTDDLVKCMVKSLTDKDKAVFMQWMISTIALNPAAAPLTSVTTAQRDSYNKNAESIFSRLLTRDCRKVAIDALKYEGPAAITQSMQVLGAITTRELFNNSQVRAGMNSFNLAARADQELKALFKAAGLPGPPK